MTLTIEIFKEDPYFVAKCKELDIYSYGETSDNAVERLKKVISFYIQSVGDYMDEDTSKIKDQIKVEDKYIN